MTERFDAVSWMRRRREEIDREDEGLSWAQRAEKTRALLRDDPLWRRVRTREVPPASSVSRRTAGGTC